MAEEVTPQSAVGVTPLSSIEVPVVTGGTPITAAWGNQVRQDLTELQADKFDKAGGTISGAVTVNSGGATNTINGPFFVNNTLQSNAATVTQLTTTSGPVTSATNLLAANGYSQCGNDPSATGAGSRMTADGKISTAVAAGDGVMVNLRRGGAPAVDEVYVRFMVGGAPGTEGGKIRHKAGPLVDYATSSDYRLKNDLGELVTEPDTLDRIRSLRPIRFSMKEDPSGEIHDGFLAHEVAEAVPTIVSGEKDAVAGDDDPNGDPPGTVLPQSVDYGKLTPLLAAAVQLLLDRNDALEARIEALEAR